MRTASRKRVRTTALWSMFTIMAVSRQPVSAFMTQQALSSPFSITTSQQPRITPATVRHATATSSTASPLSQSALPRPTDEEQQELLQQTVELRRLQEIEKDLVMKSDKTRMPLASERAQAAGYGEDIAAFEAAIDNGHKARETLVTRNMGLVHYCLSDILGRRAKTKSLSRDDLLQEGAIGLARAVDKWNPELGGKFSTYAVYWIRAAILRCIAERDDLMRVPEHVTTTARKVSKAAQRLGLEMDGERLVSKLYGSEQASWKEAEHAKALAVEAGLTPKQLAQVMKVQTRRNRGVLSFETWMQGGKNYETDLAASEADDNTESDSLQTLETEQLQKVLSPFLRPREMEALGWRYGLWNGEEQKDEEARRKELAFAQKGRSGEAMSFVEVGKQMKVSAEYGRRLCRTALDKLRAAVKEGALEPQLLF